MKRKTWKIVGLVVALLLVLGAGAAIAGGAVYATTRGKAWVSGTSLTLPVQVPEPEEGIVIASVAPDGPAAEAGLVRGDILLEMDGEAVNTPAELVDALEAYGPGDIVELRVLHGDDERSLTATLGEQGGEPYLGLVPCGRFVPQERAFMITRRLQGGALVVDVLPDSPADQAGLRTGDVIVAIDEQQLDEEYDLVEIITAHEPGDMVTLQVRRRGEETRDVTVDLGEHPGEEGKAHLGVRYRPSLPYHRFWIEPRHHGRLPFNLPFDPHLDKEFPWTLPGIEAVQGAIISRVVQDSPAESAGLRAGDAITAIDGNPVKAREDLQDTVAAHKPGDQITLTVRQPGEAEERELEITLVEHPQEEGQAYLGVLIGGFFRMERSGHSDGPRDYEKESLELDLRFESPFDDLPFGLDALPHHFEFHFPPGPPGGDEVDCCAGTV
jgi:S1-C subfamily serine protease